MRKLDKRQRQSRRIANKIKSKVSWNTPKIEAGTRVIAKSCYQGLSSARFHDPKGNWIKGSLISSPRLRGIKKRFSKD